MYMILSFKWIYTNIERKVMPKIKMRLKESR